MGPSNSHFSKMLTLTIFPNSSEQACYACIPQRYWYLLFSPVFVLISLLIYRYVINTNTSANAGQFFQCWICFILFLFYDIKVSCYSSLLLELRGYGHISSRIPILTSYYTTYRRHEPSFSAQWRHTRQQPHQC